MLSVAICIASIGCSLWDSSDQAGLGTYTIQCKGPGAFVKFGRVQVRFVYCSGKAGMDIKWDKDGGE